MPTVIPQPIGARKRRTPVLEDRAKRLDDRSTADPSCRSILLAAIKARKTS
jgi:hypothetical protein